MKKILISLFMLLTANYTYAQNICGEPCRILIDFPEGGSISAIDAMEITFSTDGVLDLGEAGTINTAIQPGSLDYSAGGSLLLVPGESITFGSNGKLDIGDTGNITSTSYSIVTSGSILILSFASEVTVNGTLDAHSIFIDSRTLNIADENLISSDLLATTGIDVTGGLLTDFSQLSDGFEFSIDENTTCIVSGSQCTTATGSVYEVNDEGSVVEVTGGSGSIDMWSLLFILIFSWRVYARK